MNSISEQRSILKQHIKAHIDHVHRDEHTDDLVVLQTTIDELVTDKITRGQFWNIISTADDGTACMISSMIVMADAMMSLLAIHKEDAERRAAEAALSN